jgi:CubicO group peptidase (beta-lactamase class C family)
VLEGSGPANSAPIVVDTVPGSVNRYSGGGFQVAQLATEDASGRRFEDWADAELFAPLGMRHSTFRGMDSVPSGWQVATGHTEAGDTIDGGWRLLPEMAAASLWSTPSDLAALMIAMQRAMRGTAVGALTPGMVRQMMQPVSANQGLGIGLKGVPPFRFSHSGSNDGYRAMFIGYLDRGEGIVAMTNGDDGDALIMEYVRAVAREYGWQDLTPRVRVPVTLQADMATTLVGRYRLGAGWSVDVERRGDGLVAGPTGRALLPLLAENDSSFFFTAVDGVEMHITRREQHRAVEILWRQGDRAVPGRRESVTAAPRSPRP